MNLKSKLTERLFNPDDLETAFRYKSDKELSVSRMVYALIRYPLSVSIFSKWTLWALKIGLPINGLLRKTLFKVFIAGENLEQALLMVRRLQRYQVHTVLDYVAEAEQDNNAFDRNTRTIMANIERLSKEKGENFISLKLTGLMDIECMESINKRIENLEAKELAGLNELLERVDMICSKASENGIGVYIDAETYSTQNVCDRIAEIMMEKYNKSRVVVYNTLQMYLLDRLQYLGLMLDKSREKGFIPGIKLVRGAYLEHERNLAKHLGIQSPVWSLKSETDSAFDKAVALCMQSRWPLHVCLATHNENSIRLAVKMSSELTVPGIAVKFSQLYGMSDHLSFNLAYAGMDVSKYLPYGEIEKAVPYLLRRAAENTSVGRQTSRELERINKEIGRRKSVKYKSV